jgi:hypothetical protein
LNDSVFTFENLYRAYLKCRKNKRSNFLSFSVDKEELPEKFFTSKRGHPGKKLGHRTDFPAIMLPSYLQRVLPKVDKILVVRQTGQHAGRVMERQITAQILAVNHVGLLPAKQND